MELPVGLVSLLAGLIMVLCGINAYRGRWRKWLQPGLIPKVDSYVGPGLLYGGIGFCLAPLSVLLADSNSPRPLTAAVVFLAIGGILIWLLSTAWLPKFMRPRWVKAKQGSSDLFSAKPGAR